MLSSSISAITTFDETTAQAIAAMLQQHVWLAQLDRSYAERSLTARNYDSAYSGSV